MWPIARTVSPAYPLLRERYQTRDALDVQRAVLTVQPRGLLNLLPQFYHEHERLQCDTEVLIDRFVANCPELYPRTRYNPLREEELRDVYYLVLHDLSRTSTGDVDVYIADGLLRHLEIYMRHDASGARGLGAAFSYRRSQHLFRSIAEVSHVNRSARLGRILSTFFIQHATTIVDTESSATIGQWCYAIMRAVMRETERDECLRRVYRIRPDLPQRLIQHGYKGRIVAERMQLAAEGLQVAGGGGDLLSVDRGIGMGGFAGLGGLGALGALGGLTGMGGLGARSRSCDRRLLLGGVDDLSGLGRAGLDLPGDDLLLADGARGRGMLQLELGPRYAQRFDQLEAPLLGVGDGLDNVLGWGNDIELGGAGDIFAI
ncbi:hypothetical protein HII31_09593 [Pseudocercospora fuligena]|uniref:Uncharacterized protein n=1 Tax=Pseudocercospora fuligena TaxID=685502 RepID=A0A8H6RFM8_9PEZI|nr:hypothetical protein HII31_09593 [Pseudocercospora fuligena]